MHVPIIPDQKIHVADVEETQVDVSKVRWSRFFGQQCCLEYKRHDYENGIIKVKTESGNHDSSPTQIRRRVQTASSGHGPQWSVGSLSRSSSGHQRECAPPLEAGGHRHPIERRT